jgi:hypothetical protein
MLNETHSAPPRYKISDFFSSLLELRAGRSRPHRKTQEVLVNVLKKLKLLPQNPITLIVQLYE